MILRIDGVEIAAYPSPEGFKVGLADLDDAETTTRTADGVLSRDRIRAGVRQIEMRFPPLPWDKASSILKALKPETVEFYYPDPEEGGYVTKTMYVGNRSANIPIERNGQIWWSGLDYVLTEV